MSKNNLQNTRLHKTIVQYPVLGPILQYLGLGFLRLMGWKIEGEGHKVSRSVVIGAPHTSNWDFIYVMAVTFALRLNLYWLGKHTLFKFPFYHIMRSLGGIPVDRGRGQGAAREALTAFKVFDDIRLVIPPEGTRSKVRAWKKGFYKIAEAAQVPVVLGFLDFKNKVGGFGPAIELSGDMETDIARIRDFYAGMEGKNPEMMGPICFTPEADTEESSTSPDVSTEKTTS